MRRYFFTSLRAHVRASTLLTSLAVSGVALGVAAVVAIQLISRSATAAFEGSVRAMSGNAALIIRGVGGPVSDSILPIVLATPGVAAAWPLVRADVLIEAATPTFVTVLGYDLYTPTGLPGSRGAIEDLTRLSHGGAAIDRRLARRMKLTVGDSISLVHGNTRMKASVERIIDLRRFAPGAGSRFVLMDIALAQELTGERGLHQIQVSARNVAVDSLRRALEHRIGTSQLIQTPGESSEEALGLLRAFRLNLTALSMISLFVGVFVVYASVRTTLLQRRREHGILRSIGATRHQITATILAEVSILGITGAVLGTAAGFGLAELNVDMVSATLTNIYLLSSIESLAVPPGIYLIAAGTGLLGALAGALMPAVEAGRPDITLLLQSQSPNRRSVETAGRKGAYGIVLLATVPLIYVVLGADSQIGGFAMAAATLLAIPLLTPMLLRAPGGKPRLRHLGFGYALDSLKTQLSTSSTAVAALAVAVSMLVGVTVMIGSFRKTLEVWMETTVRADVYVSSSSFRGRNRDAGLDSTTISTLRNHPGVQWVDRLRLTEARTEGRPVRVSGVDLSPDMVVNRFRFLSGTADEIAPTVTSQNGVLISEPLYRKTNLGPGDTLTLRNNLGVHRFAIAGIFYDYRTEGGAVAMDLGTMDSVFGPGDVNSAALYLREGFTPDEVIDELKDELPGKELAFSGNRDLRQRALEIFDETFAITRLLQTMALVIAACAIALSLLIQAREQTGEHALYRALGATRFQVFRYFLSRGTALGLAGLGIGTAAGMVLAVIVTVVINRAFFGWTLQLSLPALPLAVQLLSILGTVLIASLYPAFRASRAPATELSADV